MKTYYGQMTKEQLLQTKIVAKDSGHNIAFQEMVYRAGCKWIAGNIGSYKNENLLVVNEGGELGFSSSTSWFVECEYTQIDWLPESERSPSDLKHQLAEAIAKRDKRKAKAQKAADKLEQAEKEVQRLIAEMESDVESIGGISCKIAEMTKPEIPEGVDVGYPPTWQDGDIVVCVEAVAPHVTQGREYIFDNYDRHCFLTIKRDDEGDQASLDFDSAKFRFVRRP